MVSAMRAEITGVKRLYSFLSETLPFYSFKIYVHILTSPYLELLTSLPDNVKEMGVVFLDGEKRKLNDYAVRVLRASGYRQVWYVNRLHAKLIVIGTKPDYIVIGSSNLTARSFDNYEVILIIHNPTQEITSRLRKILYYIEHNKYAPQV